MVAKRPTCRGCGFRRSLHWDPAGLRCSKCTDPAVMLVRPAVIWGWDENGDRVRKQ